MTERQDNTVGQAVLIVDSVSCQILDANPAAARFYQQPLGRLIGRLVCDLFCEPVECSRELHQTAANGVRRDSLQIHRGSNGAPVPVYVTLEPTEWARRPAVRHMVRACGHSDEVLKAIVDRYIQYRNVAESTYDWESWLSPAGDLVWVNPAVERLTGYSVAACHEMKDYPLTLIADEDRGWFGDLLASGLAGSVVNDVEFRILRRSGEVAWGAASWQPMPENSPARGLRMSVRDISRRKEAELLLRGAERARHTAGGNLTAKPSRRPASRLVARSPQMRQVLEMVDRIARTGVNVLITGESGTGKEVIAREIHRRSARADGPFQAIDCAAIPEGLMESTLFGHAKGAFTGAVSDHPGMLRKCHGGVAFLDEIGEMPPALQAKLLRVIQNESFTPVGKVDEVQIDTRFISATNRDLEAEVAEGRFRRDLYYRLAAVHIRLPPLRERLNDLQPLLEQFLTELRPINPAICGVSPAALNLMERYGWPGNIRELHNVVERGLSLAAGDQIDVADLPPEIREQSLIPKSEEGLRGSHRTDALADADRLYLLDLLARHRGNITRAALEAGLSRQGLHKLLTRHGVSPQDFRKK